jgi:hypothetical protein
VPRKSVASLAVVARTIDRRPAPPEDLTKDEKAEWVAVVTRLPMDYFPRELHPLLADFCRRVVRLRVLAREFSDFDPEWLRTDDGVERYDRLGKLAERETRMMTSLARSLRITNQSRYQASTAASKAARHQSADGLMPRPEHLDRLVERVTQAEQRGDHLSNADLLRPPDWERSARA